MKIYFSCSLTGGRADEAVYGAIVDELLAKGHDVLTAHLARAGVMDEELAADPRTVFERDVTWVTQAESLIAEVSTPSHGVGYEIALALSQGKPVLCCYREGVRVSKMITGNNSPGLALLAYGDLSRLMLGLHDFLSGPATPG